MANLASLRTIENHPGYRFEHPISQIARGSMRLLRSFGPTRSCTRRGMHVDRSIDGPGAFIKTNVEGTLCCSKRARDYWRGLPPQRRAIFGSPRLDGRGVRLARADGKFTEESRYLPNSPYAARRPPPTICAGVARDYGLPTVMSNCSNNYGPYHFPEKLIPLALRRHCMASRSRLRKGDNVRDWLHVDDHARAPCRADWRPTGESYNIGATASAPISRW